MKCVQLTGIVEAPAIKDAFGPSAWAWVRSGVAIAAELCALRGILDRCAGNMANVGELEGAV